MPLQADRVVDCIGMLCPMPIVKLAKEIKQVQVGQVLEMVATDMGAPADVRAWSQQTGHELLDSHQEDGRFIFFVRRTK